MNETSKMIDKYPIIREMINYEPVLWTNERYGKYDKDEMSISDIEAAEKRLERFAPLIMKLFPETNKSSGIIESELLSIERMRGFIKSEYDVDFKGKMFLKSDDSLPIAGSIKARGGIYEVLKFAEETAVRESSFSIEDDYSTLAGNHFRELFSKYAITVGSTGNLGLSIGVVGSALGFEVTVHMSYDAKEWKKKLLRKKGVKVIEHKTDYNRAVLKAREFAKRNDHCYFVDDEYSRDLFLGYSVAAHRLKEQLDEMGIEPSRKKPVFVYVPCGVGGAPGGICFGLSEVFGDSAHCFFAEPTHCPCMLLGLLTGQNNNISVNDIGIDGISEADGLAVRRPSSFVGDIVKNIVRGIYTAEEKEMYKLSAMIKDSEDVNLEPSATPGLLGPVQLINSREGQIYLERNALVDSMDNAVHICWGTGGSFMPEEIARDNYNKGKSYLKG
jgi:D-serine dehydratase